jgi:branched-chain amino acid transport system ATP-binding protein
MSPLHALRVERLDVGYGRVPVIHGVSLNVPRGKAVVLLGANGAGKSTLLRGISGLLRPSSGKITLDGNDVIGLSAEALVGVGLSHVAEGRRVFRTQTVAENIELGMFSLKLSAAASRERRDEVLELFPMLRQKLGALAGALSGGQQQMLAIAQALVRKPTMLMLDEPSLGLAPIIVEEVFGILERLRAQGQSILLVEQIVDRALTFADYAYVLQNGRIVAAGRASDIAASGVVHRAYLGETVILEPMGEEMS